MAQTSPIEDSSGDSGASSRRTSSASSASNSSNSSSSPALLPAADSPANALAHIDDARNAADEHEHKHEHKPSTSYTTQTTFDAAKLNDLFDAVDRNSFPNFRAARQPWREMGITFLVDVDDPFCFDPRDEDNQEWKDVEVLCDSKCYVFGTGNLGGH